MKIRTIILIMLIVVAVVSTGSLTAFAAIGVNDIEGVISESSSTELLEASNNNLRDTAIRIRDSLDNQMKNQYDFVLTWAQSPILKGAAKAAQSYSEEELGELLNTASGLSSQATDFLRDLVANTLYKEILVTDGRGYTIASSGDNKVLDQSSNTWYQTALASVTGQYIGAIDDSDGSMDIVYQITSSETSEYLGQIRAIFDYDAFIDSFVTANNVQVWEIKVVEPGGNIVATTMLDDTKVNNDQYNQSSMAYYSNIASGKRTGYTTEVEDDENGESVYYGYAVSSDVNKHAVVVSNKEYSVNAPINAYIAGLQSSISEKSATTQRNMWIIGAAVAIVMVLAAFFVIRVKVSNPLNKLTSVSKKLSMGQIDGLELDVSGKDEIGQLGDSFQGVLAAFELLKEKAEKSDNGKVKEPVLR